MRNPTRRNRSALAWIAAAWPLLAAPGALSAQEGYDRQHERVRLWLDQVADCEVAADEDPPVAGDWVPAGVRTDPGAAGALAAFLAAGEDIHLVTVERVLLLLGETGDPGAVEPLAAAYEDAGTLVDRALAAPSPAAPIPLLEPAAEDERAGEQQRYRDQQVATLRRTAVRGVAGLHGEAAVRFLAAALDDPDPRVRLAAAHGLARQPGFPGEQRVRELAREAQPPFRDLLVELLDRY